MKLQNKTHFSLHPEVIFLEKQGSIFITFLSLDDEVYRLDQLAMEVFKMAVNDFSFQEIKEVCYQTNLQRSEIDHLLEPHLENLLDKKILQLKEP